MDIGSQFILRRLVGFSTVAVVVGLSGIFSGCVTREDIRGIQTDLYGVRRSLELRLGTVEDQTDTVQTTQADLLTEMRELNGNLLALQSELQGNQQRMSQLSMRLDDLEVSLTARMDAQIELLSGSKFVEKPLPSNVFNLANADYMRGRIPEAIKGFQDYVKRFPTGDKVPEAKLNIADGLAKQGDTGAAIKAYDDLIAAYPKHSLVPTAMIRKAGVLENTGKTEAAKDVYNSILKTYPYSSEARLARERLQPENSPTP